MRTQPVAAREVAQRLVRLVSAPAQGMAPELAGPRVEQLVDMTGRLLRARHQRRLLLPVKMPGATGTAMTGDGLLPAGPGPAAVRPSTNGSPSTPHHAHQGG